MEFPPDPGLVAVLESFGVRPEQLLGHGGEAWVYALDEERVIRVLHAGNSVGRVAVTHALVATLAASGPPFALPELLDAGVVDERYFSIERRLPGRTVMDELAHTDDRAALVEAYLDASSRLGDLALDEYAWWGDLLEEPPIRADTWPDYLTAKLEDSLARAGSDFRGIDVGAIAAEMPAANHRTFVHLDAFPGNVLAVGSRVTAVIDIGVTALIGDRRLDPLASATYLTPEITPTSEPRDRDVARSWLHNAGLLEYLDAAERWLAAYWASATDDISLHAWCRSVLLGQ